MKWFYRERMSRCGVVGLGPLGLLTFTLFVQAAGPSPFQIAGAEGKLIAAQMQIGIGELVESQKKLDEVAEIAQTHLAQRWQFVNTLKQAVVREKAGALNETEDILKQALSTVQEVDQMKVLVTVLERVLSGYLKANQQQQATELYAFVKTNVATLYLTRTAAAFISISSMSIALNDLPAAEDWLRQAGPMLKAGEGANGRWVAHVLRIANAGKSSSGVIAVYGRFTDLSKANGTQELMLSKLLGQVRNGMTENKTADAIALYEAVKKDAAGYESLAPSTEFIDKMIAVNSAQKGGDLATGIQGILDMYQQSPGDAVRIRALSAQAHQLLDLAIKSKDRVSAETLVKFMAQPDRMAVIGARTDMERWSSWAKSAWMTIALNETPQDIMSAYDRLIVGVDSSVAKELLLVNILKEAESRLISSRDASIQAGTALYEAVKQRGAALPAVQTAMQPVELLITIGGLGKITDRATLVSKLEEYLRLAGDNQGARLALYHHADQVLDKAVTAKDKDLAQAMAAFLAHKEMLAVCGPKDVKEQWQYWARVPRSLMMKLLSPSECLALYEGLLPVMDSETPKQALLEELLMKVRSSWLSDWEGKRIDDKVALFEQTRRHAGDVPALAEEFQMTEKMVAANNLFKQGQYKDAIAILPDAFVLSKGDIWKVRELCAEAQYLVGHQREKQGQIPDVYAEAKTLLPLLTQALASAPQSADKQALLALYCKTAAHCGQSADSLNMLRTYNASPTNYLLLAQIFRDAGDKEQASALLAAIPQDALLNDGKLAKGVAEFWPSKDADLSAEIKRCQGLIGVYQQRANDARGMGSDKVAARYDGVVKQLQTKVAALQKDLEAAPAQN